MRMAVAVCCSACMLLSGVLSRCAHAGATASAPPAAVVRIPARGVVSLDEGTIECWVKLAVDAPPGANAGVGILWSINSTDGDKPTCLAISLARVGGAMQLRLGALLDGGELDHPAYLTLPGYDPRKWHHIAVTWTRGKKVQLFWDGKLVLPEHTFMDRSFFTPMSANGVVYLGAAPYRGQRPRATIAIDELRISSVARSASNLGCSTREPLRPDRATVLLMSFDNVQAVDQTVRADHAATEAASEPLQAGPEWGVLPGKYGQAVSLCSAALFAPSK